MQRAGYCPCLYCCWHTLRRFSSLQRAVAYQTEGPRVNHSTCFMQLTCLGYLLRRLLQFPSLQHKASYLTIQCKYCRAIERVPVRPGLQGALIPTRCNTYDGSIPGQDKCPPNSYVVVGDRCNYVDQQQLKLQVWAHLSCVHARRMKCDRSVA